MSVSFRVFGDLHYIDETPNWAEKRKLVEYAEELLDRLIESIDNNKDIKLLINLGDIIQATGNKDKDINNLKYVIEKFNRISIPVYHILGNHELKSVDSNRDVLDVLGYSRATYSFDVLDYHFLIVGTDINK